MQRKALLAKKAYAESSTVAKKVMVEKVWAGDADAVIMGQLSSHSDSYLIIKRIFDATSSFLLLLVIWPIFLIIMAAIKIDSKGPAFFKHKRIGHHGKPIYLYKFRTMYHKAEEMIHDFTLEQMEEWKDNYKLKNDPRVTKFGRFLRKSSLDELPQIFNILLGQLSVIGPRPIIEDELEKYGKNKDKFLSIKPGLTGYWQAFARSGCSYEQRMEMELYYVKKACVALDLRIFAATVGAVLTGRGAR